MRPSRLGGCACRQPGPVPAASCLAHHPGPAPWVGLCCLCLSLCKSVVCVCGASHLPDARTVLLHVLLYVLLQYVLLHAKREALAGRLAAAYKVLDKVRLGGAGGALAWHCVPCQPACLPVNTGAPAGLAVYRTVAGHLASILVVLLPSWLVLLALIDTCLLQAAAPEDKPASQEVLEFRAGLLQQLGWSHWERQQRRRIATSFPAAYPLF